MSTLYVDEIRPKTSGSQVLMPEKPSFFVYKKTSDSSDQDYSSNTKVIFDTKRHDIGNNFDTSTSKFTVPVSGVYQLNWQIRMSNVASASYCFSALYLNDSNHWGDSLYVYANLEDPQGGDYQSSGLSVTVELSASDELCVYTRSNGDSSSRIQTAGTFFSGFLVG